jgi:hypothetical protein
MCSTSWIKNADIKPIKTPDEDLRVIWGELNYVAAGTFAGFMPSEGK